MPVIQAAADNQTATLGILTVTNGKSVPTTLELEQALHGRVDGDRNLTPFLMFWDHDSHPPLTPAQGCSVPTFHGSGADAMGIAASVVSTAAVALSRRVAAGYLLSLPHSHFDTPALTSVASLTETALPAA